MKCLKAFRKFRTRLILISIVFIIPAVILPTFIISRLYMDTMQKQNKETTLAGFTAAENQIEDLLKNAHLAAVSIRNYPEVDKYLFGSFLSERERIEAKRNMINAINAAFVSYDFLNAMIFFKSDGSMYGTSQPWTFFFENTQHPFLDTDEYRQALNSGSMITWLDGHVLTYFSEYIPQKTIVPEDIMICGMRTLTYSFSTKDHPDVIAVLFSVTESAVRDCFSNLSDNTSNVILLDAKGEQLSGEDVSLFGTVPSFYGQINPETQYGSFTASEAATQYQVIYYQIGMTGWTLVKTIPLNIYWKDSSYLRTMALVIGASTLIIMISLYSIWASRFTQPFSHIAASLRRVHNGDLSVRMNEDSGIHEFQLINHQFNQMLNSINELIEQNQRTEREKLTLELRNLQSQINPHFLYNTITSIRWMATMSGASNVSDMLIVLIELLRPVFSEWTLEWPLKKELAFTNHYMKLMRLRYGTLFVFSEDVPSDLHGLIVPRFIVQPLLENCCEHGIIPERTIHICLTSCVGGQEVTLSIHDDGRGISTERLTKIRSALDGNTDVPVESDHASVGLVNVHRRIQLYCGEQYGLSIESSPGQGTYVYIHLPIKNSDNDD